MLVSISRMSRRGAVALGAMMLTGAALTGIVGAPAAVAEPSAPRILLISATDDPAAEQSLGVALDALQQGGVAFDRYVSTRAGALSPDELPALERADGTPRYSAVLTTTSGLWYADAQGQWHSGLTDEQWRRLEGFESKHKLRRVSLYSTPVRELGLEAAGDGAGTPVKLAVSEGAASVLTGIQSVDGQELTGAWRYPAKIGDAAIATPLIHFVDPAAPDAEKTVAAALVKLEGGREQLHFLFSQSRELPASRLLAPFWVRWLSDRKLPAPDRFAGEWQLRFVGQTGDQAEGRATLEEKDGRYDASWTVGSQKLRGPAVKLDDQLVAAWGPASGSTGIAVYKIGRDGDVSGEFRVTGKDPDSGKETISRVDLNAASGVYRFNGRSERQGDYRGVVRIRKQANTYRLDFGGSAGYVSAVGVRIGDRLIVGFASSGPFGLAMYAAKGEGELSGKWVRHGSDEVVEQGLTRPTP